MTRLLTIGTFDLFHAGHVDLLERCASLADEVTVGLNDDSFVTSYKRTPPIMDRAERGQVLYACQWVDHVVSNMEAGRDLIYRWREKGDSMEPHILAIGVDWIGKDYLKQIGMTRIDFLKCDLTLVYIQTLNSLHSSDIRTRCHLQ